jgi:hypothetical protein
MQQSLNDHASFLFNDGTTNTSDNVVVAVPQTAIASGTIPNSTDILTTTSKTGSFSLGKNFYTTFPHHDFNEKNKTRRRGIIESNCNQYVMIDDMVQQQHQLVAVPRQGVAKKEIVTSFSLGQSFYANFPKHDNVEDDDKKSQRQEPMQVISNPNHLVDPRIQYPIVSIVSYKCYQIIIIKQTTPKQRYKDNKKNTN